jgi:uncharacterized membrane protein
LVGIATIPLVAASAKRLFHKPGATVAAAWLLVLSFPQTWYSQEARGYELTAFLTAAMLYCTLRYLQNPTWRWSIPLLACAATGLYVNNFMLFYIAAIFAAGLILPSTESFRLKFQDTCFATIALAIVYLPWAHTLGRQIHRVNQDFWIPAPTFDSVCEVLAWICGVAHFWTWDQYLNPIFSPHIDTGVPRAVAAIIAIAIIAALIRLNQRNRRVLISLVIAAFFPVLAALLYSLLGRSIFFQSAFVPSTVLTPLLITAPVAWMKRRWIARIAVALAILVCAANQYGYLTERHKEDWRSAAAAVAAMPAVNHRLIIFVANEAQLPFDYYYALRPGEVETGAPAGFFDIDPPRTQLRVVADSDLTALQNTVAATPFDDFVLILSHAGWFDTNSVLHTGYSDPDGRTAQYILSRLNLTDRIDLPDDSANHEISIFRCVP